jgi:hypothetical protein
VPVNIIIGLVALLLALVLYSLGVWRGYRADGYSTGLLGVLWVGVAFDILATSMMAIQAGGLDLRPGAPLVHTVLALAALGGMIVGTAVASWALSTHREPLQHVVSRALLAPWALWVAVFLWGMVTRGAVRMGA